MTTVGIVGWRGMVGSVLLERMRAENDFQHFEPVLFSTSQAGTPGPELNGKTEPLRDANDLKALGEMDMIVSCQGGDYTKEVHGALRKAGYKGLWIDAASSLRMEENAVIILDPVNRKVIDRALESGVRDFIGGNCTVSLMLMGIHSLFDNGWVEWISASTYQAASGAGAKNMRELVAQMGAIASVPAARSASSAILDLDREVASRMRNPEFPTSEFGAPLAGSLIPWIDRGVDAGQTREEWKGHVETNKILGLPREVPVDGVCVRIGAMRSHSQALTIKLTRDVPLAEIESAISGSNPWVDFVPNDKAETLRRLSPAACSGTLTVPVGRVRKMKLGPEYLSLFTVGDQLLWGAAEPLRRMVLIALGKL
ncbi:MAG: aspartate-semialdehyde dehydrogenase [Sorangiineae bacterium NIC37A_2]|nr:MAG: aspartate-semialdehyde dehydrogenase [Sorangiineae bacterium NIC37A_2]